MKIERGSEFTLRDLSEKESKNLQVFDLIRSKSVISRTDIAKTTGINMVSISNYIKSFMDNGLLFDKGPDVSTGGRKPELIELAAGESGVIGIDLNTHGVSAVLTDLNLRSLERKDSADGNVVELVRGLVSAANSRGIKVKAAGVGTLYTEADKVLKDIEGACGIKAFGGRDVYCAAFAERSLNVKTSFDSMLYVHSGLGDCVLIKDRELMGCSSDLKSDAAYLRPWGEQLSAEAMAQDEAQKGVGTKIVHIAGAEINNITEDSVIKALKEGDEVAGGIIESVGINLGLRIAYLLNIFAPRVIVVGGGIERAGDVLFSCIKKIVAKLAHVSKAKNVSIIPSALGCDDAVIGASALAVRELFLRS